MRKFLKDAQAETETTLAVLKICKKSIKKYKKYQEILKSFT
jgi:hypothetical protein